MKIRKLVSMDASAYIELRLEALRDTPEAFSSSYEEEKDYPIEQTANRLDDVNSTTFGAFADGNLIGVVTLVPDTRIKIRHRAHIFAMYVTPNFRRTGAGKALIAKAVKQAKENGTEQLYLAVTASNQPAKKLYQSFGFTTYGVDKNALKIEDTYYDDELMVLFL
ncbi:acetyltransferase [Mesobacillus campisalis]|uniref:Acetyltransferase n=1 Tax=Mesobacillus campisalis TaxID=1408103 RepID=A0A0M2SUM8_9BACI|nr:GNAT family N-acetyltransferase [Mesobacillus campisalis]KKK36702.1 acetyltransferase [Mesobacillus campisalis]